MKTVLAIFITGMLLCSGCTAVNFSLHTVKHKLPDSGISVTDNKILHNGTPYAELRFYFTAHVSENPGEAYLFMAETQHRGVALYYEKDKELVWIFPAEGRDEDLARGFFNGRGQTDDYIGWAYDVRLAADGRFVSWKKPGLDSPAAYLYSVEHGVSKRLN